MTRFFTALLLTLASTASLHAELLMRIPSFPAGDSTLSGYLGWIPIDSIAFTIDRDGPIGEGGGVEDINIGVGRINLINITKPTDAISPRLFQFGINGNSIGTVELRSVDLSHGCVVPTAAWKLDRTFVASYATGSTDDGLVDEFSFYFNKIAFAAVDEDGGVSAGGWDKVRNISWTTHGLDAALQNEFNAAQCTPGDFTSDGIVDGADFLAWQRGHSPDPRSAVDLADWRGGFGALHTQSAASTSVPEPATSMLVLLAALGWGARRRLVGEPAH